MFWEPNGGKKGFSLLAEAINLDKNVFTGFQVLLQTSCHNQSVGSENSRDKKNRYGSEPQDILEPIKPFAKPDLIPNHRK